MNGASWLTAKSVTLNSVTSSIFSPDLTRRVYWLMGAIDEVGAGATDWPQIKHIGALATSNLLHSEFKHLIRLKHDAQ